MLEIKITDPHLMPAKALHNLAVYLFALAGHEVAPAPVEVVDTCEPIHRYPEGQEIHLKPAHINTGLQPDDDGAIVQGRPFNTINGQPIIPANEPLTNNDLVAGEVYEVDFSALAKDELSDARLVTVDEIRKNAATELDARGFPYDARIHSGSRKFIVDGTWRLARGVDMDLVDRVRSEYRQAQGAAVILAPPAPVVAVAPIFAAPAPPAISNVLDFNEVVKQIGVAMAAGKITQPKVLEILGELGLPSLPMLGTRPDLIPHFHTRFIHTIGG